MLINLATGHFASLSADVPDIKVSNLYMAANPLSPNEVSYLTRPSLKVATTFADGPVRGLFYQQGFPGAEFVGVSGQTLYRLGYDGSSSSIGLVPGVDKCTFAATLYHICIISSGAVFLYDGSTIINVPIPDGQSVVNVGALNNYFILPIKGSNKFFWINPGETVIDPLSFASAEAFADSNQGVSIVSDEAWFHGTTSVEVWQPTGQADAPFQRIAGRAYNIGCFTTDSITPCVQLENPAVVWISDRKEVVLGQGVPKTISNEYVEEILRRGNDYNCWFFRRHRNDFLVISTDSKTVVYDFTQNTWYTWSTYRKGIWDATFGVQVNDVVWGCGRMLNNNLYLVSTTGAAIDDSDFIVSELSGWASNPTRNVIPCSFVDLGVNPGYGSSYVSAPIIELRLSDDQGATWTPYMQTTLGLRGAVTEQPQFRSLGVIRQPGRRFEFRFSGIDFLRIDYAAMNG